MKENIPSITAQRVALQRAAHQSLDDPKIFDDPLALRIIGQEGLAALQKIETASPSPNLRAFLAVRSRIAEDELARGVRQGVRQYVVLGAGLDTFACRSPYPAGALRVFEVDHPDTQTWKRKRLQEAGLSLPADLTFTPINFETQTLTEALLVSGFDPQQASFFSWLGVVSYLTRDAVLATLSYIAQSPRGSGLVFDYGILPALLSARQRAGFEHFAQRVAEAGEPLHTFFDPPQLEDELRTLGFKQVEDLGQQEINDHYFKDRSDGLMVGNVSHVMVAWR
jgi:methyltransferase (TIGR00027 family)